MAWDGGAVLQGCFHFCGVGGTMIQGATDPCVIT